MVVNDFLGGPFLVLIGGVNFTHVKTGEYLRSCDRGDNRTDDDAVCNERTDDGGDDDGDRGEKCGDPGGDPGGDIANVLGDIANVLVVSSKLY